MLKLSFHGGAGVVTGACYMLDNGRSKILVDCGMQQGGRATEEVNRAPFGFNPKEISALIFTHAHTDHVGRSPKLWKEGFRGKIFGTAPTLDFAKVILEDNQGLLQNVAEKFKEEPLYSLKDVEGVATLFESKNYHEKFEAAPGFLVTLFDAGHILGSSIVVIETEGKKIVFSGDLGNITMPFLNPTEEVKDADYLLVESAYGNRIHKDVANRKDLLEDLTEDTVRRGGTLLIPAFAMERTQDLLYELNDLLKGGRIPNIPVFIDSPLAIKITEIYSKYPEYYNKEAAYLLKHGENIFDFKNFKYTSSVEESKSINAVTPPKIIIAGSGMMNGGRILHHAQRYLPDSRSLLLIVGYQVRGTLGRELLDGANQVKIYDKTIEVNARIRAIDGYSAHADQIKLKEWVRPMRFSLHRAFVVQGEQESSEEFANILRDEFAIDAVVPDAGITYYL
jgi:metallo-beta-lactamase family protein